MSDSRKNDRGRKPSWTRRAAAAALATVLIAAFATSHAAVAYADDATDAFVGRLYSEVLDREPDAKGLQDHADAIRGGSSPAEVAYAVLSSEEYAAKGEGAQQTVERCYRAMLGRVPEGGEESGWVDLLGSGTPLRSVVQGFSQSDEYRAHAASEGIDGSAIEAVPDDEASAEDAAREAIVERAYGHLGRSIYSRGACSPNAMDCSGFVLYCLTGVYSRIDASTGACAYTGTYIGWERTYDPQPGDVCVYHDPVRYPDYHGHCGIYIGDGEMIDCGSPIAIRDVQPEMVYVRYPGL